LTAFLLDANLSPESAAYRRRVFGFDAVDLQSLGLGWIDDDRVVELAMQQSRVIVTQDLGFGLRYHRAASGSFGVIVIRLTDQTVESVNRVLDRFFRRDAANVPLDRALVILERERTRVIS
jgi:predicted nuclease of predicted toxin-antitoxin system